MNDDIKEILDKLKETADYPKLNYSSYDKSYNETIDNVAMIKSFACKQLLDYITNLQHTEDLYNQLLKDYDEEIEENIKLTKLWKNEVEKRRKAVEYINENAWYMNKDDEEILDRVGIEGLLDILNGDNNE